MPLKDSSIAALGRELGPRLLAASQQLFQEEQLNLAGERAAATSDLAYGFAERNKLDLYKAEGSGPKPVLLWVHGGGFIRGDKAAPDNPYNAHIGRWAARNGLVGAVMNYRLAPHAQWPSGVEDVAAAVAWIEAEGEAHGINPARIILMGTSAGAVHVAGYVAKGPSASVAGAILLSGLYGFTPLDERDTLYYGAPEAYPQRMPRDGIVAARLPLFVASAEHDPPRFQQEFAELLQSRFVYHGHLPQAVVVGGHNHFTLAMHIGTGDTRLSAQLLAFIDSLTGVRP